MSTSELPSPSVTQSRLGYIQQVGLDSPSPSWWQTGPRSRPVASGGLDFLATVEADQLVEVPASILGEGMEPFREMVHFRGAPLDPAIGDADTVMERAADMEFGSPIPTRLVAFGNISTEPIELRGSGRLAGRYDLIVTLSPTQESPGEMTLLSDDGVTGTFGSKVSLAPLFELRPVEGGEPIFVDTGVVKLPGFPMELASSGGHWSLRPPFEQAVGDPESQSLFYPGKVSIITEKLDPEHQHEGRFIVAACLKRQATFAAQEVS
jgi:hypothetical protein